MPIHASILAWSKTRPIWQQDALRRLVDQPSLSPGDIDELVKLCKVEYKVPGTSTTKAQPLTPDSSSSESLTTPDVVLESVVDLVNVNALQSDQALKIAPTGLTAVYGDNGAGKSGYVRVIKQLCRARGGADEIYPNVYLDVAAPARATLSYAIGGQTTQVTWTPGCARPVELREVSIFDSRSASVYVTDENDVAYLPHGMDLFPRLVIVTDTIRGKLEAELSASIGTRDRWADFEPTTAVYRQLQSLDVRNARSLLGKLLTMSDAEHEELEALRMKDRKYKSDDPKARAVSLRQCSNRINAALQRLKTVEAALAESALATVRHVQDAFDAAKQAADLAATGAFGEVPVTGVGSDAWKILWDAARKFAVTDAARSAFPPDQDELCVLCQQPITAEAARRLKGFEEFLRGETEAAVAKATANLAQKRAALKLVQPISVADEQLLEEIASLDETVAHALRHCLSALDRRHQSACEAGCANDWNRVSSLPASPADQMSELVMKIDKEAAIFETAFDPDERRIVENALREFEAREKLGKVLDRVDAQIARENLEAALRNCIASTNTAAITRRNTELLAETVTQPLAQEFGRQLDALNLTHIPIKLEPRRGQKAKALHTLNLGKQTAASVATDRVLSEGEHRCIALAAFFAEVLLQDSRSTLVFDDPVSSLDHSRREYVARRIVEISKNRPVLLFTHDLVFLSLLQGACEEEGVPITPRLFWRNINRAGMVENDWPWFGQKASTRIGVLKQTLVGLTKLAKTDRPLYENEARDFYGKLRDTWERAIEDHLVNGAIQRFGVAIKTQSLRNLHRVTEQQVKTLEDGMTKSSKWLRGHDHAAALGLAFPEPAEIEADLKMLEQWVSDMKAIHK